MQYVRQNESTACGAWKLWNDFDSHIKRDLLTCKGPHTVKLVYFISSAGNIPSEIEANAKSKLSPPLGSLMPQSG
jgi:hypothetical protein